MKLKKFTSMAIVASMAAMSLAGCSDAASSNAGSTAVDTAKADTAEAGSADSGAAAVTAEGDGKTFKIGSIGPLTGGAANYGNAVVNATELAVKEVNANGGINGYQVEFRGEDDELDNEKSINAYNALKDWGMQFLVGSTTSGCSIAVSERSQADNLFQLTPSGSAVDCTKYDNVFRVCFSDPAQGAKSAQYIGENKLAKTIGIIYDSSDVYSSGIEQTFVQEAKNQGLEVKVAEAFTADSNTDFTAQLQKCKDANVDMIFLPIYYTQAATILTQASTLGIESAFFGCDGLDGMLDMDNFDEKLAEGVMLLTPFAADASDDLTVNFVTSFKDAYKVTPNQFAADAYDAVYAIKAALEEENATPDMSVSELCEAAKSGMTKIKIDGLTGNGMTWSADGEPDKAPKAVEIKSGAYVSMEQDAAAEASSTAA